MKDLKRFESFKIASKKQKELSGGWEEGWWCEKSTPWRYCKPIGD